MSPMRRRRIDFAAGRAALDLWARDPESASRDTLLTAVRFTLEELEAAHPGRAVEVRVPPAGAVQILPGATHRRGTPPAVVETSMDVWLRLATGQIRWAEAVEDRRVCASGERTDLTELFPVL